MPEFTDVTELLLAVNDHAVGTGHTIVSGISGVERTIEFICSQCHFPGVVDEFVWYCSNRTAEATNPGLEFFRSPYGRGEIARLITRGSFEIPSNPEPFRRVGQVSIGVYEKLTKLSYRAVCFSPVGFVAVRKMGKDRFRLNTDDAWRTTCGFMGFLLPTGMLIFQNRNITTPVGCMCIGDPWEVIESLRVTPPDPEPKGNSPLTRFEREEIL